MLYRFAALLKLEWSEVATSSDKARVALFSRSTHCYKVTERITKWIWSSGGRRSVLILVVVHVWCRHRHYLLLLLKILMLLWLEILLLHLVVLLLLLVHQCQLHIRWWCEAAGHGERAIGIGVERVGCSKAASVGHTGDLLPPCLVFVEAVE